MPKRSRLLFGLLVLCHSIGYGATYEIDPVHSSISFKVKHMVGYVTGEFTKFAGKGQFDPAALPKLQVEATIDVASLSTRNERRDQHLKSAEFFNADKYPQITFRSKKVTVKGKNRLLITGDLTMHGVTRPVTLNATYNGQVKDPWGNIRAAFTATTTISRKSFGISWNKTLDQGGVMIGDTVAVSLEIEAVRKK